MIGLLKKPLPICQTGWGELQNALLVIHWVVRGPEKGSQCCFADVTRNFKIQQRGWQRGRQEKNNRFYKQNNNFFVHFSARVCTNTTWKCLILRFMEYVNKQRLNVVSLSALGYGPRNSTPGGFAYIWHNDKTRWLLQRRQRWQREQRQKGKRFKRLLNCNKFCMFCTLFGTFLCRPCTTATCRGRENIHTMMIFFSQFKLGCNSSEITPIFTVLS